MKLLKNVMFAATLLTQCFVCADPEPYESVRNISQTGYYFELGYLLFDRINAHHASVVIDVGSFEGEVARYVAQNSNGGSIVKVYAVNEWVNADDKFSYQRFLSNVKQENTTNLIVPIRMSSEEAAGALNVIADVIYIHAKSKHSINEDIVAWSTHLSPQGVICGDNWENHKTQIAVTQAAAVLDLVLRTNGNFWYLERQ